MDSLVAVGLGLEYGVVRLQQTTVEQVVAGRALSEQVAMLLDSAAVAVEHIGSSSVIGLLAKPIVDLAVGVRDVGVVDGVVELLQTDGWIYRGDAGSAGGHVFVLEELPWYRIAHLHVVDAEGSQWRNYLTLRDRLRADPSARERYARVKSELAERHPNDRAAYTDGKDDVVRSLLDNSPGSIA